MIDLHGRTPGRERAAYILGNLARCRNPGA